MADYSKVVAWSGKDALADSSAAKVISGADFHTEFTAVETAINTKADINGDASEAFSATTAAGGTDTTQVATTAFVQAGITAAIVNALVYPVGSIYFNATVATNPATLLGFGTWAIYGAGKVMVGLDSSDADFNALTDTGGSKTHTLTTAEMPAHTHTYGKSTTTESMSIHDISGLRGAATTNTSSTGGGGAHNNLQPYVVIHMWKRTA
jgi:hypothetical protein